MILNMSCAPITFEGLASITRHNKRKKSSIDLNHLRKRTSETVYEA
jgi:hypothetical protein